jgi:cation transport ATPase
MERWRQRKWEPLGLKRARQGKTKETGLRNSPMKILTDSSAKLARILLLVASVVSIPLLFIVTSFERAGGGTQRLQYLLIPLFFVLIYFCYVLYKRISDKNKALRSKLVLIVSEFIIGLTALTFACLAMYDMIRWYFEIPLFIIFAALIWVSLLLLSDSLKDLKKSKRIVE